jgi:hypothetical protein
VPQQVDIGDATRFQFSPGATSATVDGELVDGETKSYVLGANAGQTMTINIWSPNSDVYQTITGVSDGKVLVDASVKATLWTGTLPATQDYLVDVIAGNGRTSYSMGVIIPAGATATAGPTPTLSSAQFDPNAAYGKPKMVDPMNTSGSINWTTDGKLPNTEDIQMTLQDDKMYVTGKQLGFATWWFSLAFHKELLH